MNNVIAAARALLNQLTRQDESYPRNPVLAAVDEARNELEKSLLEHEYQEKRLSGPLKMAADFRKNTIRIVLFDGNGNVVMQGSRSSTDPAGDFQKMDAFLDLEQAYRLRSVEVKPFKIGALWVTSQAPETQFLDREMTSQAGMWRMLQHVINRCEAGGLVATIDLEPWKGVHRIGGYTMVGKIRPCAAEIRRQMAEPCCIVKAGQQDGMFAERFVDCGGEIQERFDADRLCAQLNKARTVEEAEEHFFRVVPASYTLDNGDDYEQVAKRQAEEIEEEDPRQDHGYHNPSDYR